MKVQVTLEFAGYVEAAAALRVLGHDVGPQHVAKMAETPAAPQVQQVAPQTSTVAIEVTVPAVKTADDVNKAFTAYVQKGGGRSAKTGREILEKHGLRSFKEATPEQCAALIADYETL